jgi:predicted nucleic-acid-binding Zn-ribbon protein
MSHAQEPVAAAAPHCKTCGSTSLNKLQAELALHFNELKNIDKPVLWTFPDVVVCADCGEAEFHCPPHELQWWDQAAPRKQTRVIFVEPSIVQTCRACGSTELRTYSSEVALHAPGRGNLYRPALFLFPQVIVCRDCGAARFTVPVSELHPWLTVSA